jgi:hypothetical protein
VARQLRYDKQLSALVETEQYDELNAIAEKQGISLGDVTRWAIRKGLVAYYSEGQPNLAQR